MKIKRKGAVSIKRKPIRLLLADDHAVLRSGLKALLTFYPDFIVIGEAENGLQALQLVEELAPDLLLLDLSMPDMNGVDCIKEIRARNLSCPILVLTMYDEAEYIKEVMHAGANGYVLKKSADTELVEAIRKVHSGQKHLSEKAAHALIDNLLQKPQNENPQENDPYRLLSSREREVLRYLAQGYTNSEIARQMSLSPKTIDTYRSRIMSKLDIHKKSELVNYAIRHKLLAF